MQAGFAFLFSCLTQFWDKGHRGAKLSTSLILPRILKSPVVRQVLFILFLSFLKIDYIFLLSWELIFQLQMASCFIVSIQWFTNLSKQARQGMCEKWKLEFRSRILWYLWNGYWEIGWNGFQLISDSTGTTTLLALEMGQYEVFIIHTFRSFPCARLAVSYDNIILDEQMNGFWDQCVVNAEGGGLSLQLTSYVKHQKK